MKLLIVVQDVAGGGRGRGVGSITNKKLWYYYYYRYDTAVCMFALWLNGWKADSGRLQQQERQLLLVVSKAHWPGEQQINVRFPCSPVARVHSPLIRSRSARKKEQSCRCRSHRYGKVWWAGLMCYVLACPFIFQIGFDCSANNTHRVKWGRKLYIFIIIMTGRRWTGTIVALHRVKASITTTMVLLLLTVALWSMIALLYLVQYFYSSCCYYNMIW